MKHLLWCLGIVVAAHAAPVPAQTSRPHHHHSPAAAPAKPPPKAAPAKEAATKEGGFRSAFSDYRPFNPDEPLKDWRASNDEVREAGGHVGILKSQEREGRR